MSWFDELFGNAGDAAVDMPDMGYDPSGLVFDTASAVDPSNLPWLSGDEGGGFANLGGVADSGPSAPVANPNPDYDAYDLQGGAKAAGPGAPVANPNPDYDAYDLQGGAKAATPGALSQIMKGLGLSGNLSDPKSLESWMKLLMGGSSILNTLLRGGTSQNSKTPTELAASMPGQAYNSFTPAQQASADKYFKGAATPWEQRARISAANMRNPIVAGRGYAEGGEVDQGALSMLMGGGEGDAPFVGAVQGPGGGQDDLIDAKLAAGEYVFDADVVSALGDGDNAQGAALLDQFRQNLRSHKRGADPGSIPPPTGDPMQYMPQGALEQTLGAE